MMRFSLLLLTASLFLTTAVFLHPDVSFGAACPVQVDRAYRSQESSAVYYVDSDCKKRVFRGEDIFFTYFTTWKDVRWVSKQTLVSIANHELNFMPFGPLHRPKDGSLVKTVSDLKVYVLSDGMKYWTTSESVFLALGYHWDWIEDVDPRLMSRYQTGTEIQNALKHVNGTLVKYADDPRSMGSGLALGFRSSIMKSLKPDLTPYVPAALRSGINILSQRSTSL